MSDSKLIKGSCLCKKVTYEITRTEEKHPDALLCHCEICQRSSGSIVSYNAVFPLDSFKVTSEAQLTEYKDTDTASSKPIIRCFCSTCGSAIVSKAPEVELAFVKVPSFSLALKDKSGLQLKPGMEIFTKSKEDWSPANTVLEQNNLKLGHDLKGKYTI